MQSQHGNELQGILCRNGRLEKCLVLAEQLGARDLAMVSFSMHYVETASMKCVGNL